MKGSACFLLLAFLCAGCAGTMRLYRGPARPPSAVAVIESCAVESVVPLDHVSKVFFTPGGKLRLTGMNGKKFRARRVESEPGNHEISVNYRRDAWRSDHELKVSVEAGKTYRVVGGEYAGGIVVFWVEEAETRRTVAGERPGILDP